MNRNCLALFLRSVVFVSLAGQCSKGVVTIKASFLLNTVPGSKTWLDLVHETGYGSDQGLFPVCAWPAAWRCMRCIEHGRAPMLRHGLRCSHGLGLVNRCDRPGGPRLKYSLVFTGSLLPPGLDFSVFS